MSKGMVPVFKKKYNEEIKSHLKTLFGWKNDLSVPKVEKVVLSIGTGGEIPVKKAIEILEIIAAQKAVVRKAKKSIAAFKIREGMETGAMVTCRSDKMYFALQRLFLALLNWRNFPLLKVGSVNVAGGKCQITIGIPDATIVHGIQADASFRNIGFSFTIVSNAKKREHFVELLKGFGFPFVEGGQ